MMGVVSGKLFHDVAWFPKAAALGADRRRVSNGRYEVLSEVKSQSVRHFFNLAAAQIRRAARLCRQHFGPEGQAAFHLSDAGWDAARRMVRSRCFGGELALEDFEAVM